MTIFRPVIPLSSMDSPALSARPATHRREIWLDESSRQANLSCRPIAKCIVKSHLITSYYILLPSQKMPCHLMCWFWCYPGKFRWITAGSAEFFCCWCQVKARPRFQPTMEVMHPAKGRFPTRPVPWRERFGGMPMTSDHIHHLTSNYCKLEALDGFGPHRGSS